MAYNDTGVTDGEILRNIIEGIGGSVPDISVMGGPDGLLNQLGKALYALAQSSGGDVTSFNTRTGAVTLEAADVTGVVTPFTPLTVTWHGGPPVNVLAQVPVGFDPAVGGPISFDTVAADAADLTGTMVNQDANFEATVDATLTITNMVVTQMQNGVIRAFNASGLIVPQFTDGIALAEPLQTNFGNYGVRRTTVDATGLSPAFALGVAWTNPNTYDSTLDLVLASTAGDSVAITRQRPGDNAPVAVGSIPVPTGGTAFVSLSLDSGEIVTLTAGGDATLSSALIG
jgi:hypothetical protein